MVQLLNPGHSHNKVALSLTHSFPLFCFLFFLGFALFPCSPFLGHQATCMQITPFSFLSFFFGHWTFKTIQDNEGKLDGRH